MCSLPSITVVQIIALTEGITPHTYVLDPTICILGRASTCHVVVRHALVSRYHARIEWHKTNFRLVDTNSVNGTFINGDRLTTPRLLYDQDIIGLGGKAPTIQFMVCARSSLSVHLAQ